MKTVWCSVKKKDVVVREAEILAGAVEDLSNKTIAGRIECSDSDHLCDYSECPIQKGKL